CSRASLVRFLDSSDAGRGLKRAQSPPRITARRGGGVIKQLMRSLLIDADGVVFLVPSIGAPPRPRKKRMLRNILFDRSATPPRGDARRGVRLALDKRLALAH